MPFDVEKHDFRRGVRLGPGKVARSRAEYDQLTGAKSYGDLLKADLVKLAEERGIEGASAMKKDELVAALEG